MKKLLKKLLCLTLAVLFVFSIVACGDSGTGTGSGTGSGSGTNTPYTPPTSDKEKPTDQTVTVTNNNFINADGTTEYKILLPDPYTSTHNYAAQELNLRLKQAAGIELPIVREADGAAVGTKYISIGATTIANESQITYTREELTRNGFKIESYKDAILIVAPNTSGLLYGMYRFMEQQIDYMYYNPNEVHVGDYVGKDIKLKHFKYEDWPDFLNRNVFNYETTSDPQNAARLYNNGYEPTADGGKYGEGTWWSSLNDQSMALQILPADTYRELGYRHWFTGGAVGSNGTNPQICYTQALYSQDGKTYADVKDDWAANPGAYINGLKGMFWAFCYNLINNYVAKETTKSFFQLGMSDNNQFCTCSQCNEDVEKYTRSGIAFRFANAVADVVKDWQAENCPDREIYLTMFAYLTIVDAPVKREPGTYVWTPIDPSVIVRDNIVVRYAPIQDYYLFPLTDEINNPQAFNAINGWAAVAKNFAVWDYRINFGNMLFPFPQWMSNYENIKTYYDYGYVDVFHQGCRTFSNTPFVVVDNWVRSRLLWDVDLSYEELMHQAINAYYGEAGPMMEEYLEYLTLYYMNYLNKENGWKAHSHHGGDNNRNNFPRGVMLNVEEIFSRAYEAIKVHETSNPERYAALKFRLDAESIPYRYWQLSFYQGFYTVPELEYMVEEWARIVKEARILGDDTFGGMEDITEGFRLQITNR